jgi:hypothetical protein
LGVSGALSPASSRRPSEEVALAVHGPTAIGFQVIDVVGETVDPQANDFWTDHAM